MSRLTIKERQAIRAAAFPSDRIAFSQNSTAAIEDAASMKAYVEGEITLTMLCRCFERNNYLPKVTEEQALNELKITGWIK